MRLCNRLAAMKPCSPRTFGRRMTWRVLLCALLVLPFGKVAFDYFNRPVFHNVFRRHEFDLLPRWVADVPKYGASGTFVLNDDDLNMLIVVPFPGVHNEKWNWRGPYLSLIQNAGRGGTSIRVADHDGLVRIPATKNRLIVVMQDGRVFDAPLCEGEARFVYRQVPRTPVHEIHIVSAIKSNLSDRSKEARDLLVRVEHELQTAGDNGAASDSKPSSAPTPSSGSSGAVSGSTLDS